MSEREEKKAQFRQEERRSHLPWIALALVIAAAAGILGWKFSGSGGKYPSVAAQNGFVSVPAADVNDGRAHFYSYESRSGKVDFFLLKSRDGVIRAALDACDVCYREKKGYRQEGDAMVCNNCGQQFPSNMISEVKGGCNPAPLTRSLKDGRVLVAAAELDGGARYFQGK